MGVILIKDGYGYKSYVRKVLTPSNLKDLKTKIHEAKESRLRLKVLGNASNILLARQEFDFVVLKLNSSSFKEIKSKGEILEVGAGVNVKQLLNFCIKNSLGGLEFLIGIPGTVGGAVAGNAGAFGYEISDFILKIDVIDYEGILKSLNKKNLKFGYRYSNLKDVIIVKVYLKVFASSKEEIRKKLNKYIFYRLNFQELKLPSSGCFFKNPNFHKTKDLLNSSALSGQKRGGALISIKNPNFLVSKDNTNREDILALKDVIQRKIWKEKRIWLEPEVIILW